MPTTTKPFTTVQTTTQNFESTTTHETAYSNQTTTGGRSASSDIGSNDLSYDGSKTYLLIGSIVGVTLGLLGLLIPVILFLKVSKHLILICM